MRINYDTQVLVSVKEWFVAPNGKQYRAIFGKFGRKHVSQETYLKIGNVRILESQIICVTETETVNFGPAENYEVDAVNGIKKYMQPSLIYNADEPYEEE